HVPQDENSIRLPPEGDVPGGVAGYVDHLKAGDLVAATDRPVALVPGAVEDPPEEHRHEPVRLALADQVRVLGGGDVRLRAPEGNAEPLAGGRAAAPGVRGRGG